MEYSSRVLIPPWIINIKELIGGRAALLSLAKFPKIPPIIT
jgi:hypothetical protein